MRIKGKGSVAKEERKERRDCRRWRIVFQTDEGPQRFRFYGNYTQACEERDRLYAELTAPKEEEPREIPTYGEWAASWLDRREKDPDIKNGTVKNERHVVNLVTEKLGDVLLTDLTPSMMQDAMLDIREERGLSGTYCHKMHCVNKKCLKAAVWDDLIPANPLDRVKSPKLDTEKRTALTTEQTNNLLGVLTRIPLDAHTVAVMLAVLAGMRRGEICALRWTNVVSDAILVREGMDEDTGDTGRTKTPNGVRDIPMVSFLKAKLAEWRKVQTERQGECEFVCAAANGNAMRPQNLYRWWIENRGTFGVDVGLHDLRHTYLTLMAAQGAPASVLKSLAGWSDIAMANTYVHADSDADARAVADFERIISPN